MGAGLEIFIGGIPIGAERKLCLATVAFHCQMSPLFWGEIYQEALDQLSASSPARPRVLILFADHLVEDCARHPGFRPSQAEVAHHYLLEALRLADEQEELSVLHRLAILEWKLAKVLRSDPPSRGIYFNLAQLHHLRALPLYSGFGSPQWCSQEQRLSRALAAKARKWSPARLREAWSRPISALHDLMLLGVAAVLGVDEFVDAHDWKVREAVADSWEASTRCEQLTYELEELTGVVDEEARQNVLAPWSRTLARVYA